MQLNVLGNGESVERGETSPCRSVGSPREGSSAGLAVSGERGISKYGFFSDLESAMHAMCSLAPGGEADMASGDAGGPSDMVGAADPALYGNSEFTNSGEGKSHDPETRYGR